MQYRTKATTVDAVRFTGDNHAEVEAFIDAPVEWESNPRRPIVPTPRGNVLCNVGEWVLRAGDGGLAVESPKNMSLFFEEVA
jgi:hypothetical protein